MQPTLHTIRRYPVKGLSAQGLSTVDLSAGRALPWDRRFGLLSGPAAREAEGSGGWRPKSDFITLMRHEKLAALEAEFDPDSVSLVIKRAGRPVARGRLDQHLGRMLLEQFFAAYMGDAAAGAPRLIEAEGEAGAFTDKREPLVSLLNLASVRDLEERIVKRAVDAGRFRANLWLSGLQPWTERAWIGRTLAIGDARLEVVAGTGRCAATEVDPATTARDLNMVQTLQRAYGHTECGVYARVVHGGRIETGATVTLLD